MRISSSACGRRSNAESASAGRRTILIMMRSPGLVASLLLPLVAAGASVAIDDGWMVGRDASRIAAEAAVIGPDAASETLALPGLVVLDARDEDDHRNERLPGAVLLDDGAWKRWSLDGEFAMLDHAAWRREIAALGVDSKTPVLVVDDGSMTRAPRIWFILHRLGVRGAMVADGGLPAWREAIGDESMACGDPGESGDRPASIEVVASAPDGPASPAIAWLDRLDMLALLGDGRVQLVDVRSEGEFDGSRPLKNPRGGHLPGAVVLPHGELLAEEGGILPPSQIRAALAARGLDPDRPVVVYCQSGARATLAALALARAGVGPVACYYEGFGLWSKDDRCPVVVDAVAP